MVHAYEEASRLCIPGRGPIRAERTPFKSLLSLATGVGRWLPESTHLVCGSAESRRIYLLYRNSTVDVEALWEFAGVVMAEIDRDWPLCALGTADTQETVQLRASYEEGGLSLVQRNISGKSAEILRFLCFQVTCPDERVAAILLRMLRDLDWEQEIIAADWMDAEFLEGQELLDKKDARGFFCYASPNGRATTGRRLLALRFDQKVALWTAFLRDGFDPLEFEWLADEIDRDALYDRIEWELALWETIERLEMRVVIQKNTFELFDREDRRLYFGSDCRRAAERVLMKILFPLSRA